jgi:putative AdoMet-dependent methyltransferase
MTTITTGLNMMSPKRTPDLFDAWASNYDYYAEHWSDEFPFFGYKDVLNRIVELSSPINGKKVLDLGIGTGALALRYQNSDCEIWGLDFSEKMLEKARAKLPKAHLLQSDIQHDFPEELGTSFDIIVSAYTFHHFDLDVNQQVVKRIVDQLLSDDGRLIIGDISFKTSLDRDKARKEFSEYWDDDEYYFAADVLTSVLSSIGSDIVYEQVSRCAGIYVITPSDHL